MSHSGQPKANTLISKETVMQFVTDYFDSFMSLNQDWTEVERGRLRAGLLIRRADHAKRFMEKISKSNLTADEASMEKISKSKLTADEASFNGPLTGYHYVNKKKSLLQLVVETSVAGTRVYQPITVTTQSARGRPPGTSKNPVSHTWIPLHALKAAFASGEIDKISIDTTMVAPDSHTMLRHALERAAGEYLDEAREDPGMMFVNQATTEDVCESIIDQALYKEGEFWLGLQSKFPNLSTGVEVQFKGKGCNEFWDENRMIRKSYVKVTVRGFPGTDAEYSETLFVSSERDRTEGDQLA